MCFILNNRIVYNLKSYLFSTMLSNLSTSLCFLSGFHELIVEVIFQFKGFNFVLEGNQSVYNSKQNITSLSILVNDYFYVLT